LSRFLQRAGQPVDHAERRKYAQVISKSADN